MHLVIFKKLVRVSEGQPKVFSASALSDKCAGIISMYLRSKGFVPYPLLCTGGALFAPFKSV
jgi:hypothetical protein